MPETRVGGDWLLEFVASELGKEEDRRSSLEARGLSVATIAGAIVALLTALRQVAGSATLNMGQGSARVLLFACIFLFVCASFVGALTNTPRRFSLVDPQGLLKLAPALWEESADSVKKMILSSQLLYLDEAQRANDHRGRLLFSAIVVLALAVMVLALAVSVATI
jgi:hypothetical protein